MVDYAKQACLFNVEAKTNHGYVVTASLRVDNTRTTTRQKIAKDVYSPCKCIGYAKSFVLAYGGGGGVGGWAHA